FVPFGDSATTMVITQDDLENLKHTYESWYDLDGNLVSIHHFKNSPHRQKQNMSQYINDSGTVYKRIDYVDNRMTGKHEVLFPNGQLKRYDLYRNDTLLESTCHNRVGEKVRCRDFYKKARYIGGTQKLTKDLFEKITYPEIAIEMLVEGSVIALIYVDTDSTTDFTVVRSPDPMLEQAVLKALDSMPFAPATEDGIPVASFFPVFVRFSLRDDLPIIKIEH